MYAIALHELARQVASQCAEQGQLLANLVYRSNFLFQNMPLLFGRALRQYRSTVSNMQQELEDAKDREHMAVVAHTDAMAEFVAQTAMKKGANLGDVSSKWCPLISCWARVMLVGTLPYPFQLLHYWKKDLHTSKSRVNSLTSAFVKRLHEKKTEHQVVEETEKRKVGVGACVVCARCGLHLTHSLPCAEPGGALGAHAASFGQFTGRVGAVSTAAAAYGVCQRICVSLGF